VVQKLLLMVVTEGPREVTGGGGGEQEPNKILLQELAYVLGSKLQAKTLEG
jgi:hypothetical protein